jgi:predicted AAA+ superfamily ATPase
MYFRVVIRRDIQDKILQLAEKFPVIALIGPRQSGKTTLVKKVFPDKEYVNLEEPDTRLFAQNDPRSFLSSKKAGLIIDEVQRVPDLFSYIQTNVDEKKIPGSFILTGSHNFLMQEKISQTLAGRVAILTLLPFSLNEVRSNSSQDDFSNFIFKGFYPPIYDRKIEPTDWYPNYIRTYLERDVRLIKNIPDLNSFTLFVKLCAGRIGQLVNLSSLAVEAGISVNTVKSWLSVLEASYIIFRLEPHFQNFNKRLVKMPKLYFYDTGLACSLLGLDSVNQISTHYLIGSLFENLVLSDLLKYKMNNGLNSNFYYWRDKLGREVDCLIDSGLGKIILEIKSGKTINEEFFNGLKFYKDLSGNGNIFSYLIYGGGKEEARSAGNVLPWHKATMVFEKRR